MTSGTCSDDTPFYLDGAEVLCMRCSHRRAYHMDYDELHKKVIFWADCHKLNKIVGLPIDVCEHFKNSNSHQSHLFEGGDE